MILLEVAPQTPRESENKLKNEFFYSLKPCILMHGFFDAKDQV